MFEKKETSPPSSENGPQYTRGAGEMFRDVHSRKHPGTLYQELAGEQKMYLI